MLIRDGLKLVCTGLFLRCGAKELGLELVHDILAYSFGLRELEFSMGDIRQVDEVYTQIRLCRPPITPVGVGGLAILSGSDMLEQVTYDVTTHSSAMIPVTKC